MKLRAMTDGILIEYIQEFYSAQDDHDRAIVGAFIVGYLENLVCGKIQEEVNNYANEEMKKRLAK